MKSVLALFILSSGCSSSFLLDAPPEKGGITFEVLRKAVEGERATISLRESTVTAVVIRQARHDSIVYEQWRTIAGHWGPVSVSVPFSHVVKIQTSSPWQGVKDWAGICALSGAVITAALWSTAPGAEIGPVVLLGVATGVLVGGPIGGFAGLFIGHSNEYHIRSTPEQ